MALRKASVRFDAASDFKKIQAKVLYVLSRTDKLFPPSIAPAVMDKLASAGVPAQYFEIDTDFGHQASGTDWAKWAPALEAFLREARELAAGGVGSAAGALLAPPSPDGGDALGHRHFEALGRPRRVVEAGQRETRDPLAGGTLDRPEVAFLCGRHQRDGVAHASMRAVRPTRWM